MEPMRASAGEAYLRPSTNIALSKRYTPARVRRTLIVLTFSLFLWFPLAWGIARFLIVKSPLQEADAIVVLSGSAAYKERTRHAAAVFNAGRAPRIILTNDHQKGGWSTTAQDNPYYFEMEQEELVHCGVPRERIIVLKEPVDGTYEETILLRRYVESEKIQSILVVTSAYHSRRAWWTLRRVFNGSSVSVGLEPVDTGFQTPRPSTWWFHLRGWKAVPTEYVKLIYYWFRLP
jgi:uncharacterized SAM-binding protein YcdF (DUF218 family)